MKNELKEVINVLKQIDFNKKEEAENLLLEGSARLTSLRNKLFSHINDQSS